MRTCPSISSAGRWGKSVRKRKEVTLDHIVEKSGLSKVTISKALNNKDGVSEEVKLKVREIAEEVGYKFIPSKAQDNSKHIGIILQQMYIDQSGNSTFYLKFYQELTIKLNSLGYICNLFTIIPEEGGKLPPMFLQAPLRGVISIGNIGKEYVQLLTKLDIPTVFLDYYYGGMGIDCVVTDNYFSTYNITKYLIDQGHQKIGFVGRKAFPTIQDRLLGYCRALMEVDLPLYKEDMLVDQKESGELIELVLPQQMPTAFVCNGDDVAYRFMNYLKERGYSIPEDISIVGFDDDIYSEICTPKLTTVAVNREEMIDKAIEILVGKINGTQRISKGQILFIPGDIVYRDSVRDIK